MIEGLDRLLLEKKFTKCIASAEALEIYKKESNTVVGYIEELELIPDPQSFRLVNDLYKEYRTWCRDSGYVALAKNPFSKEFDKQGFSRVKKAAGRGFYVSKYINHDTNDTLDTR